MPPRSQSDNRLCAFGPFIVDPLRGQLRRDDTVVALTPKAFQILVKLVHERGEVVSRDTLLGELWPHVIVEENTLAKHVSTLRKALRATPEEPEYIVTVSGRGYRLAAPIVELPQVAETLTPTEPIAPAPQPLAEPVLVPPSRAGYGLSLFGVLAIALLAAVTVLNIKARYPLSKPVPQSNLWQLTYGVGLQQQPTWSPDGRWIAYSDDVNGHSDIWVQPVGDGDAIRITSDKACDAQPAWSPDGTQLAFQSERDGGGLFVVPAMGGTPRRVASFGCCPQWSPDGTQLLFFNQFPRSNDEAPAPYVVSVATGATRQVLVEALEGLVLPRFAWHPDGRRVSMWAREASTSQWHFRTASLGDGRAVESVASNDVERRLNAAKLQFTGFAWGPDGNTLYLSGNTRGVTDLWRLTVDPATLAWIDGPDRLTTGVSIGADADLALSPDGSRLAFTARRERTRVWELPLNANGHATRAAASPLTPQGIAPAHVDVSPSGKSLVYQTTRAGYEELWVQRLTDGTQQLVAGGLDGQMLRVPRWSRDGKQFASHRGGSTIVVRDDAANREWPLTGAGNRMLLPSDWSRDGSEMLVTCAQADPRTIGVCRLALGDAPAAERSMQTIAVRDGSMLWQSRFSPDDRWITFVAFKGNDARASTIYVMPASGGEWLAVTTGGSFEDKPRWSADGRTVYFVSNRSGLLNVWGRRFDPAAGKLLGEPFRVTKLDSPELTLLPNTEALEMSVSRNKLFLPLTEISGQVWILENVAR